MFSRLLCWWRHLRQIRTQKIFDFLARDRLGAVLVVVGQHQLVVVHINRVHEGVDQPLLECAVIWIAAAKLREPVFHILSRHLGLLQFRPGDAERQFFFLLFQLFQPLLGGGCENPLLDGVDKVLDPFLGLDELPPQPEWSHLPVPARRAAHQ